MLMSMSVGPYCDLGQDVDSKDWRNGAAVSLVMDENEREFDRCPMYFNDGSEPWTVEENYVRVFNFDDTGKGSEFSISVLLVFLLVPFHSFYLAFI
uniref:Putative LOC100745505 [Bombus impatiens] n=1 Tax=Lepeophtheirus salmonis TaxID=72036 RepID=A0A0K2UZJ1_LEPSM